MNDRYHGKRFASLILVTLLLFAAYVIGKNDFSAFSTAIGLIYGAYLTGQSTTDWKKMDAGNA